MPANEQYSTSGWYVALPARGDHCECLCVDRFGDQETESLDPVAGHENRMREDASFTHHVVTLPADAHAARHFKKLRSTA